MEHNQHGCCFRTLLGPLPQPRCVCGISGCPCMESVVEGKKLKDTVLCLQTRELETRAEQKHIQGSAFEKRLRENGLWVTTWTRLNPVVGSKWT